MQKFRLIFLFLFVISSTILGRSPLESYKNYMFVLVHGVGGNNMKEEDNYSFPNQKEEVEPRKSAIWDLSYDDKIPSVDANNWMLTLR